MIIYTVRPLDSLDRIAETYHISPQTIAYDNQISYPFALAVGQALLLTQTSQTIFPEDILTVPSGSSAYTGGYAYPFISQWVLNETLPFLTDLYIFSYGFTPEGEIIPPSLDDTFMITAAKTQGTAPILTLTPFGADGMFNNALIHQLVNNETAIQQLIQNLETQITARGFEGVDIDFEYILPEDRVPFAEFVAAVRSAINVLGYPVSVALAPKISDTQTGLLYEGKDYGLLGKAANYVLLMTYEWGYTYPRI